MIQLFPWSIWDCLWLAPLALLLDFLFGDPDLPWRHPVCLIGSFLNWQNVKIRSFAARSSRPQAIEKVGGFVGLIITSCSAFLITFALVSLPWLGAIFAIYLAWAGLAMGCLLESGKRALSEIETGEVTAGRLAVSWLVSRDTSNMDQSMLRKTLADTLAENFTDAFLAPYFWLIFTGPAGLWFYKAVSTMDSQWGYLAPKWRNIGFACAKCDDALAYIPARLSPVALYLANRLARLFPRLRNWTGSWPGFKKIRQEAKIMPSPNSGWPMAACSWLCNGRMAGPARYFGAIQRKPWMGPKNAPAWDKEKIESLCQLMVVGTVCGGFMVWGFGWLLSLLI